MKKQKWKRTEKIVNWIFERERQYVQEVILSIQRNFQVLLSMWLQTLNNVKWTNRERYPISVKRSFYLALKLKTKYTEKALNPWCPCNVTLPKLYLSCSSQPKKLPLHVSLSSLHTISTILYWENFRINNSSCFPPKYYRTLWPPCFRIFS